MSGGGLVGSTVNATGGAVTAPTVTVSGPVVAELGTVVTSDALLADSTGETMPLNATVLALGTELKPWPFSVTVAPGGAEGGLSDETARAGGPCTVKEDVNSAGI